MSVVFSVHSAPHETLAAALREFDEDVGMTVEAHELGVDDFAALMDLCDAVKAAGPAAPPALKQLTDTLFWSWADEGTRLLELEGGEEIQFLDSYLRPASVQRLARLAAGVDLEALSAALEDFSGDGGFSDGEEVAAHLREWFAVLDAAAKQGHAVAIAVWG